MPRGILLSLTVFSVWGTIKFDTGEVDLVNVSARELGLTGDRKFSDEEICSHALDQGLRLCPIETVDQLYERHRNQPNSECLRVASELVFDSSINYAYIFAFYVGKGAKPLKGSRNTRKADEHIIFVQPRK